MRADALKSHQDAPADLAADLAGDLADARMVAGMRLVLAVSALLASLTDPLNLHSSGGMAWMLFAVYAVHSLLILGLAWGGRPSALGKTLHWLDIGWYAVFVALTGDGRSMLFLFFLFAILAASFRWGFEEGARVTVAATALFSATAFLPGAHTDLPRLVLRSSFLLALGYISAYWGQSKVALNQRLALLRDVSQLSNPRFGVDHTLTRVLEKSCEFFKGSSCVLVLRDKENGACKLRSIQAGRVPQTVQAQDISAAAAGPLLALPEQQLAAYRRSRWLLAAPERLYLYDAAGQKWRHAANSEAGARVAELLDGAAFISAPVLLRGATGRIFVLTRPHAGSKDDALFLAHVVAQAFSVIENMALVDRMASEAASQERRKMSLDIHDRAVQPYIGLTLGLSALRNKAAPGNPLADDLAHLTKVARQAIEDLRHYAGSFRQPGQAPAPVFSAALQQQTARIRALYGVDIEIDAAADLNVNDRMSAEVLQIVREGLSNICRHTRAQEGVLRLQRRLGCLHIEIGNAGNGEPAAAFSPRSITERVMALGGRVRVHSGDEGSTTVQIEIPV
jgi:signal transduction histidine kinase